MEKINLNPSVTPTKAIVATKPIKIGGYKVKIVPILLTILLVCSLVYGSYLFVKNGTTRPPVQDPEPEPVVDDENVNDTPTPEPPKEREFVYDFIINHEHASYMGIHLGDILVDDERVSDSVVVHQEADRGGTKKEYVYDEDGDQTMAMYTQLQPKGLKFMTVTLKRFTRPVKFTLTFARPMFAPGWIIKENDVVIYEETSNRGRNAGPAPVMYDYMLPFEGEPKKTASPT
tara:strand:- start:497 stop:1189 length:693 start_codon:yes stop_codon:yes gene_type:complete